MIRNTHFHAIVGNSTILRDRMLRELLSEVEKGAKKRCLRDPKDLELLLTDVATPSLFNEKEILIIRATAEEWYPLKSKNTGTKDNITVGDVFYDFAGQEDLDATVILIANSLDARLQKKINSSGYHQTKIGDKDLQAFVIKELLSSSNCKNSNAIAYEILETIGNNVDTILNAISTIALYADGEPITIDMVKELLSGTADKPSYEFSKAFLSGNVKKGMEVLYSGRSGIIPEIALATLANDIRKQLSVIETDDPDELKKLAGMGRKPSEGQVFYMKKDAKNIGKVCLQRLLHGVLMSLMNLRKTGVDPYFEIEVLMTQAQRIIRSNHRA